MDECKKCGEYVDTDVDDNCYVIVRVKPQPTEWISLGEVISDIDAMRTKSIQTETQCWCDVCRESEGLNHYRDRV